MRRMVEKILQTHGTDMTVSCEGVTKKIRGFFQPVRSKSWQNMVSLATPLGEVPRGQYTYIGPAGTQVKEGDTLTVGGNTYLFRRVEPFLYGNEVVYLWGLCVEKGVNDTWGSQS